MTQERIFDVWAPATAIWSPWVKPTLFAYVEVPPPVVAGPEVAEPNLWLPDLAFLPRARSALVLDLPGEEGVELAGALARRGYRPVPLYNAVPRPTVLPFADAFAAVVDVQPIVMALYRAAEVLQSIELADDAPPAFLLDANRRRGQITPRPGDFDNRSVSFPTDFPSANILRHHGVNSALLIQRSGLRPQADVAHTLRGWQAGGVALRAKALDGPEPASALRVAPVSRLRVLVDRWMAYWNFRRHPLGGFGGMIPLSSGG